jgi:hypothetical protein
MRSARKAKAQNELKLVGRKKAKDKQKLKKKKTYVEEEEHGRCWPAVWEMKCSICK